MASFQRHVPMILMILALVHNNEAIAPVFLQAITSALGTIPFTAGPMTTGLVGAKLAVGSKLLYYLGLFGRRRSKSKPAPVSSQVKPNFGLASGGQFPGGMQAVPLPYTFGAGAGAFPQQFMGFGQPNFYSQHPYGYDPAQLFQMLVAQGIDPLPAMQAINFNGGAGSQAIPSSQFPFTGGAGAGFGFPATNGKAGMNPSLDPKPPVNSPSQSESGESESDVDSFFSFLRDMDDNTCISRLICDIGANPSFLGEFSENIHSIIGQLEVQPSSGAFQYISIMETGKREGGCDQRFPQCSDAAYEIVKNVAPSVGVPQNINSETVNQL